MNRLFRCLAHSLAIVAIVVTAVNAPVCAGTLFTASLSGLNEVPPAATRGYGFGSVLLNDTEDTLTADLSFYDLTAGATAAHIHQAPAGVNGPVVFPFVLGPASGQTTAVAPQHVFAVNPAQVAALKAGQYYINVHTSVYPGGEIRGQINAIPEPGTLALVATGLAPLFGVVLRKRR